MATQPKPLPQVLKLPAGTTVVVDSEGGMISVPRELYSALVYFQEQKKSGSIVLQFKFGGIAGVETNTRQVLK